MISPKTKLVHRHGQVARLTEALVDVAVIHGDQVHVTKYEAFIFVLLQSFHIANVQQLSAVEGFISVLKSQKHMSVLKSETFALHRTSAAACDVPRNPNITQAEV